MDRVEAMSIVLHAVEAGSLSKASRNLGLPLATVSRKISELEAHLHATLFTRSAKGLMPTPAGHSFITAAKAILELVNEAERTASGEYTAPKGDLAVSAPTMFGRLHVLPVLKDFLNAYPEVDIGLVLTDRIAHLVDDQVDVALRIGHLPDSALTAICLGSVRRVVCASPDYFAQHGAPVMPDDLRYRSAITFDNVSVPGVWHFYSGSIQLNAALRSRLSVNTTDAAIDAAIAGMGLARANSYQIVDHVRRGALVLTLEAFEPPPRPVSLIYNSHARLPLKLRAFIDFVTPRLRARLKAATL
jgi:DNA-binding transcriptional LysR family regulator